MLHEENTKDTRVDKTSLPVTPAETGYEHGEYEAHEEDDFEVVAVLEDDDGIFVEI